jgi:hypothetical protein
MRFCFAGQSGAIVVIVALLMAVLLGFGGLVIDLGYLAWVKADLQRAADAGALAGARASAPYIGSVPAPNWSSAGTTATQTVRENSADNQTLTDCQVQSGYWSLSSKTLQSTGITPTATDVPAIQVTVTKTAGKNGGPLQLFLGPFIGINALDVSAQAVAMLPGNISIPQGAGFPYVAPLKFVTDHWNDDPPQSFKIGSSYHYLDGGQWTSFLVSSNADSYIKGLINNGNPNPVQDGQNIWIANGTNDNLFVSAASLKGKIVLIPIVANGYSQGSLTPVLGFFPFYVEDAKGGSSKYVQGHFVRNYVPPGGGIGGNGTGAFLYPRLTN